MRVNRREPRHSDEQREFHEILEQFKRGIDENLESDDYQAHYDLGVAFKEMGLLDEAIAEFQKALRSPEGRLRTSEALGMAFFEKGQYAVGESVLRRAVDGVHGRGRRQDRAALLAGARLGGAGEGCRCRSPAMSARWPWTSGSWISASGCSDSARGGADELPDRARSRWPICSAGFAPAWSGCQQELRRIVEADFGLITEVNSHLFQMQGKMFRPTLLLLAEEATGGPRPARDRRWPPWSS